jgi:hypothetical protein
MLHYEMVDYVDSYLIIVERSKDINMSQSKDAKAMLDFLFCWAVYPTLEEGIGPALHQRVNSRVADIGK